MCAHACVHECACACVRLRLRLCLCLCTSASASVSDSMCMSVSLFVSVSMTHAPACPLAHWGQVLARGLCDSSEEMGREDFKQLVLDYMRSYLTSELTKSMRVSQVNLCRDSSCVHIFAATYSCLDMCK